jgi:penicillin-binding protein 1B
MSRRLKLIIGAAVLLGIPILVLAFFLIQYYFIFNAIIEEKLGSRLYATDTQIYAAPTLLYPGKPLSPDELTAELRRYGYVERTPATGPGVSYYQLVEQGRFILYNEPMLPEDADLSVEITCSGDRIRSIVNTDNQTELARLSLKPELLSNVFNEDREKRRLVSYRDLPRHLVNAVLASEDRRFFLHSGIDPVRIIKALIIDIKAGDTIQGASTLTQQFVKNYFLTPEKTWKRKLTDIYMAILLEQRLSKRKIFELWANEVYLGQRGSFGIVGFGEAAGAFFGKSVKDLTLGESAILAGIISAPNRYTPLRHPERAMIRRDLVLGKMADYGMISAEELNTAKSEPIDVKPSSVMNYSDAPYFVDYLQVILSEDLGDILPERTPTKIYTSLDMDLQRAAFESIKEGLVELDEHFATGQRAIPPGTVQASLIAVDPRNGRILSMIGGRNYGDSQFNRITQSRRQPGSIFKPFVFAAAIETAYTSPTPLTVSSTFLDEPTKFPYDDQLYEPKNFKEEYLGEVTLRQAIAKSLNIATIKIAEEVGYQKIAELAHRLGLKEQVRPYPALAIGAFEATPLEIIAAYTAFANGGMLTQLNPIIKMVDPYGNVLFQPEIESQRALTSEVTFMLTSLMQTVMNSGTGAGVRSRGFRLAAAGKTGTSHDGWFAGFTPDLLCIVWVGFDDNLELKLSGAQSALPIWASFMNRAVALRPLLGEEFDQPENICQVEIDPTTGLLATDQCQYRRTEFFIKGTEPLIPSYGSYYNHTRTGTLWSVYSAPPDPDNPESK